MSSTQQPKSLRLVGYCRVSTNGQALLGVSIPAQEQALAAWCAEHGHELVVTFREEAVSGAEDLDGRVAFIEALDTIERGEADGLVVFELDRLARDVIVQENLLREIWSAGGRKRQTHVFSTRASENEQLVDDATDPTRKLVRIILGSIAEWDRAKVAARLQRGRSLKHKTGNGYCGGPTVAYGEIISGIGREAVRVPDPDRAPVVARIHQLRTTGATFDQIAEQLNADEIPTARGGRWMRTSVKRVADRAAA